jgi:hypothetical protein
VWTRIRGRAQRVIGAAEELLSQVRVRACVTQAGHLLAWAVEGAGTEWHFEWQIGASERFLQPSRACASRRLASSQPLERLD